MLLALDIGNTMVTIGVFNDSGLASTMRAATDSRRSVDEYVRVMTHTNGLESHWAQFKRGIDGINQHVSVKHLPKYTTESGARHNNPPLDTSKQMEIVARSAAGKQLPYSSPIGLRETRNPRML